MSNELEFYSEKELLIQLLEQKKEDEKKRKIMLAVIVICTLVIAGVLLYCTFSLRNDMASAVEQITVLNGHMDSYARMIEDMGLDKIDFEALDPSKYDDLIEMLKKFDPEDMKPLLESLKKLESLAELLSKSPWFK